ncbi:MAG: hypothetical protein R3B46_13455 [Phycisphaerales bacterium]
MVKSRPRVILTHGEERPREVLAQKLRGAYGMDCARPEWGDVIEV